MNQPVFVQDIPSKAWQPGIIVGIGPAPRSYVVQCSLSGRYLQRNRIHIRPRRITFADEKQLFRPDDSSVSTPIEKQYVKQPQANFPTSQFSMTGKTSAPIQKNSGSHVPSVNSGNESSLKKNQQSLIKSNSVSDFNNEQGCYRTRYGRMVKPPKRLDM